MEWRLFPSVLIVPTNTAAAGHSTSQRIKLNCLARHLKSALQSGLCPSPATPPSGFHCPEKLTASLPPTPTTLPTPCPPWSMPLPIPAILHCSSFWGSSGVPCHYTSPLLASLVTNIELHVCIANSFFNS